MRNWLSDLIACILVALFLSAVAIGFIWIIDAINRATGFPPFWSFVIFFTASLWSMIDRK